MHMATSHGTPLVRPLFYDYPEDPNAYKSIEYNFMFGPALKVSPLYESKNIEILSNIYFPEDGKLWCPLFDSEFDSCFKGGSFRSNLKNPIHRQMAHIGQGSIVPI